MVASNVILLSRARDTAESIPPAQHSVPLTQDTGAGRLSAEQDKPLKYLHRDRPIRVLIWSLNA